MAGPAHELHPRSLHARVGQGAVLVSVWKGGVEFRHSELVTGEITLCHLCATHCLLFSSCHAMLGIQRFCSRIQKIRKFFFIWGFFSFWNLVTPHFQKKDRASQYRYCEYENMCQPVLRIHDILVWSGDPCLWLMDPDPGSGSCYFRHRPSRSQQETIFFLFFFFSAYYFLKAHLHFFQR